MATDGEPPNPTSQFLEEWYVNNIVLDRRQYFLFSEARTLYSVVVPSKGITSRKNWKSKLSMSYLINSSITQASIAESSSHSRSP